MDNTTKGGTANDLRHAATNMYTVLCLWYNPLHRQRQSPSWNKQLWSLGQLCVA